jgi:hypothetical protein
MRIWFKVDASALCRADEFSMRLRRENLMIDRKVPCFITRKFGYGTLLLALLLAAVIPGFAETIDATAMGTSTQLGHTVSIKIIINRFSSEEDRQVLVQAFQKGQNPGLVKALEKMPSVGRIAITGTLGYDLAYIRLVQTPTGRQIRFATNRLIRFAEAYYNTQSQPFDLTAGQIDLNDKDKNKSGGVLYPASQLIVNNKGELQFELRKNPWNLVNIIDWNGAGKGEGK